MCYNKEVSITSFIVGAGLSILVYKRGDKYDKHVACFLFTIALMQLAEYFMWIDQECGITNHNASTMASLILYLQILTVIMGGYYFNTFSEVFTHRTVRYIFYTLFILWIARGVLLEPKDLCSRETTTGHLEWQFTHGSIDEHPLLVKGMYLSCIFIPWLFLKNKYKGILLFFLLALPFLYLRVNFKQWESLWCLFSASIPAIWLSIHKKM